MEPESPSRAARRFRRRLAAIVAVGAVTRLVIWAAKWDRPLSLNDSLYYSVQAFQLARGHWYVEPFTSFPGAEHPPLTSTLMASLSWMDDPVRWQRLVTAACGIATVALIGMLGRALHSDRAGLIAAGLAVVAPNLWMNDGLVMSESVSVLTVVITLLALWRAIRRPGVVPWAWAGLATGLAALARSELVLLIPLGAIAAVLARRLAAWRRRLTRAGVLVAAALATLAPWVVFNLIRFERPVLLTTNDGTTLAGASCDPTFDGPVLGGWTIVCLGDVSQTVEPSVRAARQRDQAIAYVRAHLDRTPQVVAARLGRTLDVYGLGQLVRQDVGEERWAWASWSGIVSFWLLAPLAVYGLTRLRRGPRWLLLAPVVVVLTTTVLFYGAHRIRSSAEPTIVIAAAVAIATFVDRRITVAAAVPGEF